MSTINFDGHYWMAPVDWGDTAIIYNFEQVDWIDPEMLDGIFYGMNA